MSARSKKGSPKADNKDLQFEGVDLNINKSRQKKEQSTFS